MACATLWPHERRSYVHVRRWGAALAVAALCAGTPAEAYELVSIKATRPAGAKDELLQAELFKPKGEGPFPTVVLMHGCGGWQTAVLGGLHSHAMYLIDRGYAVLNLDSFGARGLGGGTVCESIPRLTRALDYRTSDALDALRFLQGRPFVDADNIFLMGQSNGGSVAINAAKMTGKKGYRAVAAYYPWCGSLGGRTVKLSAPLIIFSGGRDDWVPARQCRHKVAVGAPLKVVEYASAAHSFDLPIASQRYLGKLIGYDKPATEDSRARMVAFFDAHKVSQTMMAKATPETAVESPASVSVLEGIEPGWYESLRPAPVNVLPDDARQQQDEAGQTEQVDPASVFLWRAGEQEGALAHRKQDERDTECAEQRVARPLPEAEEEQRRDEIAGRDHARNEVDHQSSSQTNP